MTFEDRVRALEPLGFTPRQTRFMATVALHSGYCLRRQYSAFAGVAYGKNVCEFLETLVARQLAERFTQRADRGLIYHLHARAIYRALGEEDNRNRRNASAALIARKIMVLDFVLGHPDVEWLGHRAGQGGAVCRTLRRPAGRPATTRLSRRRRRPRPARRGTSATRCPSPWPATRRSPTLRTWRRTARAAGSSSSSATMRGCWVVAGLVGPRDRHAVPRALAACEASFARYIARPTQTASASPDDLRWLLSTRQLVDQGDLARLSVAAIDRYRSLLEHVQRRLVRRTLRGLAEAR